MRPRPRTMQPVDMLAFVVNVSASVCIDAPSDTVWEHLARLEDITLWSEAVIAARCDGARTRGVGAERTCDLKGGMTIRERWLAWDEGHSFVYEGSGIPFVARAQRVDGVPDGRQDSAIQPRPRHPEGRSHRETTRARRRLSVAPDGRRAMAAFKFLVENGRPPAVKHSRLPVGPSVC